MLPWIALASVATGVLMISVGVTLKLRRGRYFDVGTVSPEWIARQKSTRRPDV